MSFTAELRSALRERLLSVPGRPDEIQLEGRKFTAPTEGGYLRETLAPIGAVLKSVGPRGRVRHTGLYMVDVFYPPKEATGGADPVADAIVEHFWPGLQLTYGTVMVTIRSSSRSRASQETDWRMVPVSISYFFDRLNPQ